MFTVQLKVSPESLATVDFLIRKHLAEPYPDTSFTFQIPIKGETIQQLCSLPETELDLLTTFTASHIEQLLSYYLKNRQQVKLPDESLKTETKPAPFFFCGSE